MKKVIFSGYLANDKDCFVEIAMCSYDFLKDGKKESYYYATAFEISPSFKKGNMCSIESANDLVSYVRHQQMCQSDVETMIKNINKNTTEAIAVFGLESETHLFERMRKEAYEDDYFDELPDDLKK